MGGRPVALAAAGARLVPGDFDAPAGLAPALDGAAAVFAVPPVTFDANREVARGRALIDAASAAGVEQMVLSTSPRPRPGRSPPRARRSSSGTCTTTSGSPRS
ncbi:NmrA family NAD(P)-binding protein [Dactylosporangium sp. CA-052675]|uniref:NmrA family NAD(P)-binding protein n=1 Tax=Dactylosporangium sp. CA-052675 TaxID=3239927 RepID=UPI003D90651A